MKLGHDTASVINWMIETKQRNGAMPIPAIGTTMTELLWTDRELLVCVGHTAKGFLVQPVATYMKSWTAGTTFPELDADGKPVTCGAPREVRATKTGYRVQDCDGKWFKISLSIGDTTGYSDPSF